MLQCLLAVSAVEHILLIVDMQEEETSACCPATLRLKEGPVCHTR